MDIFLLYHVKPLKKPCYICGDKEKKIMKGSFGHTPILMVICLKCTNITFFITTDDINNRKAFPMEQVPAEVKAEFGL